MLFHEEGTGRLRASLRGSIPVAVATVALPLGFAIQGTILDALTNLPNLLQGLLGVASNVGVYVLIGLVAVWLAAKLDRRSYTSYGLDVDRRWLLNFGVGTASSALAVAVSVWYAVERGIVTVTADTVTASAVPSVLLVGLILLASNAYEEVLYRGIALQTFAEGFRARGLSPMWAVAGGVAGSLCLFGVFHLIRGPVVALDATIVGVTFALAYVLTGELGLAMGVHFGRLPMGLLVQDFGIEFATMEMPTDPVPYLEFTLLQLGLVCIAICLWTHLSTGTRLTSELSAIATAPRDSK